MFYKKKIYSIEKCIEKTVKAEVKEESDKKDVQIKNLTTQFNDYKDTLTAQLKSEISNNNMNLGRKLTRSNAVNVKELGSAINNAKTSQPHVGPSSPTNKARQLAAGGIPEEEIKTAEAYDELAKLQEKVHKLRLFYFMRLICQESHYKKKLQLIKTKMNENGELWEKLSLGEKREIILKQELINAQENLASSERVIRQLQGRLKEKTGEIMRFKQAKVMKSQRMDELEKKLKKYSVEETIDLDLLQKELKKKDKEINDLKAMLGIPPSAVMESASINPKEMQQSAYSQQKKPTTVQNVELKQLKRKLRQEENEKMHAFKKVEELQQMLNNVSDITKRQTIAGNTTGADPMNNIMWREKCQELLEMCKGLKSENDTMRGILEEAVSVPAEESKFSGALLHQQPFIKQRKRTTPSAGSGIERRSTMKVSTGAGSIGSGVSNTTNYGGTRFIF